MLAETDLTKFKSVEGDPKTDSKSQPIKLNPLEEIDIRWGGEHVAAKTKMPQKTRQLIPKAKDPSFLKFQRFMVLFCRKQSKIPFSFLILTFKLVFRFGRISCF